MSNSGTSDEPHGLYDVSRAFPLSANFVNNPSGLCYHRFYDDSGTEQEIFVPPEREQEILDLDKNRDWNALLKFPAFSDRPPPPPMRGNCVGFPQAHGTMKNVYVPEDDASQARMSELMIAQDYKTLEQEFEPWNNQPHSVKQKEKEWARGVERYARARDEEAKRETQSK